jgi:hypothetical protein
MAASQDFRDGASTGAALVAKRARTMISWGVPVDDRMLDKLAEGVVSEYGGRVYTDVDPSLVPGQDHTNGSRDA